MWGIEVRWVYNRGLPLVQAVAAQEEIGPRARGMHSRCAPRW